MAAENYGASDIPKNLQNVESTQRNKDLIATLPSITIGQRTLHQYNGFWHSTTQLQGILNSQKYFKAHDSDVLLVTLPKSGTTWLKALAFAILYRKIHHLDSDLNKNHPLHTTNPHDLVPFLDFSLYVHDENIPDLSSFQSPRLFACHIPYVSLPESVKSSKCKIVYLSRNPKDMFTSLWHFRSKLLSKFNESWLVEDAFEQFCEGKGPCGPFWDHILEYYKQSLEWPNKVFFLKFEELKSEPIRVVKELAEFIGHRFTKEEENGDVINDILKICSFENMSNLEVNKTGKLLANDGIENQVYFRRGEVGDGENFLNTDMVHKLDAIIEEKLGKHGVSFQINKS